MRKLIKRIFVALLIIVILLNYVPTQKTKAADIASGVDGKLTWSIDSEGCLRISGSGDWTEDYGYWISYADEIKTAIIDIKNITNTSSMFYDCTNLTKIDMSNLDTSNVTNMSKMFSGCYSLTSLDVSKFDTSNVIRMDFMFYCCTSLTNLDISNFDVSKVTDMSCMLEGCGMLTKINTPKKLVISDGLLPIHDTYSWYDANGAVYTALPINYSASITLTLKENIVSSPTPSVMPSALPTQTVIPVQTTPPTISNDVSVPVNVKWKSCKAKKRGKVVLKWEKVSDADGYQVQYARKKSFKGKKSETAYGKSTTLWLKSNKKYFIRVRAYTYDGDYNKVYGKWSSIKKIKTKK